ncbi:MAG: endonuclease/exonuclease/phosphatase family protein [Polyangiaceae bacterium]|jgi:endonuclease/exonuclease/phosphatase family metal-dependent hydrolase|nr:endonuclease/exonuclease/phosphatase family protein [Polyangiaceae bacterium]
MPGALATLPFAWWNTKVAPPSIESKATKEHRNAATSVVRTLVEQKGCLVVALAEVRRESIMSWLPDSRRARWDVLADTSNDRHDFDVAIVFDRSALSLKNYLWARRFHATQAVRAGLVATFDFVDGSGPLVVIAAHWRTDAGNTKDAEDRRLSAAQELRDALGATLQAEGKDVPVLILGDFNAEPFDRPFGAGLPTARSRAEVQRHRPRTASDLLFYNAAWRWLGERDAWNAERKPPTLAGTYRLGSNTPTAWRTFDQVLVSPSLLRGTGWSLDESALEIYDGREVFDQAKARPRAPFDHLPIVGRLQRFEP